MSTVHAGSIPLIEPKDVDSLKWLSFEFSSALATNESILSIQWLLNDIPVLIDDEVGSLQTRKVVSNGTLHQVLIAGGIVGYRYKITAMVRTNYREAVVRSVYMMISSL